MKLDIYAGKKKIVSLVPHFDVEEDRRFKEWCGNYAIPGGKKANEESVRSWAKEYGYSVKTRYELGDGYAENFHSTGHGRGEAGNSPVCESEPAINVGE